MDDYREKSFWLETAGEYTGRPPLEGHQTVDVAVVGGGFTGLSTALHLKERRPGLRVAVLEAGVVGGGASGRNAGFSMPLFGLSPSVTVLRYGKARLKEADQYMVRAVEYTEQLVDRLQIDCDYERHGMVTVATQPAHLKRLQEEDEVARQAGLHPTEWLDRDQVRQLVDSPTYLGGRYDAWCALLQPAKLARGMARAAEAAGAQIYDRTPVTAIYPGGRVRLETPGGSLEAAKVVLATNGYSAGLAPVRSLQVPIHTYIALTEPLTPEQVEAIGWHKRVGVEDGRVLIHYYRLTPDNRVLMGGHDATYHFGNKADIDQNPRIRAQLERTVTETFPALRPVRFTHHWGGPISGTLDLVPAIGRRGPNIVYSVGCMGHGVSLSQLNGRTLTDLVLEEQSELTEAFFVNRRMLPVPPEPLRYSVVSSLLGAMRLLDRWENRRRGQGG
ncbi:MAG: NAD(P)/FAD-dependent oxidoreductase [Bacillota bacterium]